MLGLTIVLSKGLEALLALARTLAHDLLLVVGRRDHKVYLCSLVAGKMCRLLVEKLPHLLVLTVVEHPLQQPFQLVLAHDCLRHYHKSLFGHLPDVLAGVLQILCKCDNEFVVFLEE